MGISHNILFIGNIAKQDILIPEKKAKINIITYFTHMCLRIVEADKSPDIV